MNKQNQNQNSTFSRQTNQTNSQHNSSYQQNQQQKYFGFFGPNLVKNNNNQ